MTISQSSALVGSINNKIVVFPTSISFSHLPVYNVSPLLEIFPDPHRPFFQEEATNKKFKKWSEQLYLPTLQFLLQNKVETNLIVTGNFLQQSANHYPAIIECFKQLIDNKLVTIVADCYWGESLTSIYNIDSWVESLQLTVGKIKEHLLINVKTAFLPQLFRNLELEKLTNNSNISTFVLRQRGKKYTVSHFKLSQLRRFQGQNVYWLKEDQDVDCKFYFVPDTNFFEINGNLFQPDLEQACRTFCMAIGYYANQYTIRKQTHKLRYSQQGLRIPEKPSFSLMNPMQRSVMRLWEYGLLLVASYHKNSPSESITHLFHEFLALQNKDFLFFLQKHHYQVDSMENFSSPYEAFVHVQARTKQVELILKNKI